MLNTPNQADQFSWPDILWRLVITILILVMLAGFSLTIFNNVTAQSDARVLPTLTQDIPGQ